jgi:hypothetical protein
MELIGKTRYFFCNLIGQQLLHVMKVKKRKDYREFAVIYINSIFSNKLFR